MVEWGFQQKVPVILLACAAGAIAAPAKVIYVDAGAKGAGTGSSWTNAYSSVQDALAAATAADKPVEIRVGLGVYKPDQGAGITPGDRMATFRLANGVTIKGGYAGMNAPDPNARDVMLYETVLSGDLAGNDTGASLTKSDNGCCIVTGSGTDSTAVIDGFTIAAGSRLSLPSSTGQPLGGTGMLIDSGSPTVLNCCFRDHYERNREVLLACNGSSPVVAHCTFLNNVAVGMGNVNRSDSVVTDCRFEGNVMEAMKNSQSDPVITRCQFIDNGATTIQFWDCNSTLTDCVFTGGDGNVGREGIHCIGSRLTLTGCTITGFKNGAMEAPDDLTLVHCAFRDNSGHLAGAVRGAPARRIVAFECAFVGNEGSIAGAISNGDVELHDCEFTGNSGSQAGAVETVLKRFIATGCVFSGNYSRRGVGAISSRVELLRLSHCTFAGNRGQYGTFDGWASGPVPMQFTQCIVRDGPKPFKPDSSPMSRLNITYGSIQGGYPGEGNIDVDPCFVDPGYWDPNGTPDDPNDDFWVAGDYHLKSQAGHWDRVSAGWVRDDVTSLCIDAGDPNASLGVEPFPNGGFINMGANGGTAEASKSYFGEPVCESQIAGDINGDCIVDQADMDILLLHWLMEGTEFVNQPPTITLLSPRDGDEFTYPTPIVLQSLASDADGVVVRVAYVVDYHDENRRITSSSRITNPTDNWHHQRSWPGGTPHYGAYTIWAEAMDNEGATATSPRISVTLHPAE